jgi:hypothetical protein
VALPCSIGYRLPGHLVPVPSPCLRGSKLVKKRVTTATPALCLLQRRQLLWLAEQTAGAALLGAPSLVVGDLKLSADAAPQARPHVVRITTFNPAEMRPSGQHSNPSQGLSPKRMVRATQVLSNQKVQSSLSHLARKLACLRDSDAPPRTITSRRRRARRPGRVHDAVVRVLADYQGADAGGACPCGC